MNYQLSEQTRESLQRLIRQTNEGGVQGEQGVGARFTTNATSFVDVKEQLADYPIYSGLPVSFAAEDLTWNEEEATCYVIDREAGALQEGRRYAALVVGDYELDGETLPVYIALHEVSDTEEVETFSFISNGSCTGSVLSVSRKFVIVSGGEMLVCNDEGQDCTPSDCTPYLSALSLSPYAETVRYFAWTADGLLEGASCETLEPTTCITLVKDVSCSGGDILVDVRYVGWRIDGFTLGYSRCPTCCAGGGGTTYTDEEAQDAVGTILVDSTTIDLTYTDATPSITAAAITQMSITSDASGLKFSGDSATPGNTKLYGTNGSGTKGWYDQPSGGGLDITGLTAADPAIGDEVPIYDITASANRKVLVQEILGVKRMAPGGRLTATSGAPVSVATSTTLRYTPYLHDCIDLWDGTRWITINFSETSKALTATSGAAYDVWGYLDAGSLALETLVWSSATARSTAITIQDGRYCKSGDKTRLLLGSFQASNTNATGLTASVAYLWNMYNRVRIGLYMAEATDSWTYATTTWRAWNGGGAQISQFRGLDEDATDATCTLMASGAAWSVAIGADSTTTPAGIRSYTSSGLQPGIATYIGRPGLGIRNLCALEYNVGLGTTTAYGDNAGAAHVQSGIVGSCWC